MIQKPFSYCLKKIMSENDETIESLAEALNIREEEIVSWRSGTAEPSTTQLLRLAKYFECTTDELLGNDEEEYEDDEENEDEDDEENEESQEVGTDDSFYYLKPILAFLGIAVLLVLLIVAGQ